MRLFQLNKSTKRLLKYITSILVVSAALIFFIREFAYNIGAIKDFQLKLNFPLFTISFILFFLSYILATYSWKYFISYYIKKRIPFTETLAVFNVSRIVNYIPGMVWGYGVQMYWLSKYGGSKFLAVFAGLVLLVCNFLISLIFFVFYFSVNFNLPTYELIILLFLLIALIATFSLYCNIIMNSIIKLINSIFKRNICFFHTQPKIIIHILLQYLLNYFLFGFGGYLLGIGIGLHISSGQILTIISIMAISDLIGLIVIIAPGGLGIRESIMFLSLKKISIDMALILPIAARIATMAINFILAGAGLLLYKYSIKPIKHKSF